MKKRIISLLLALVMLLSLMPVSALAATPSIYDYFKDLPVSVNPDAGSKVWKTTTLNGETVASIRHQRQIIRHKYTYSDIYGGLASFV